MRYLLSSFFKRVNLLKDLDYASFFRISIAFLALTSVISYGDEYYALFAGNSISLNITNKITENKEDLAFWLYNFLDVFPNTVSLFFWLKLLYIFFLVLLLFGFISTISGLMAFFLNLVIYFNSDLLLYGYDIFMYNSLLLCALCSVNSKLSVDNFLFAVRRSEFLMPILRVHLCICYLFSGLSKAFDGEGWWNGQKMVNALHYSATSKGLWFADLFTSFPIIPLILGVATVILEISYPIFIWRKRSRFLMLSLTILMHIFIWVFLDLLAFASIMIIWNFAAFYDFDSRRIKVAD